MSIHLMESSGVVSKSVLLLPAGLEKLTFYLIFVALKSGSNFDFFFFFLMSCFCFGQQL